MVRSLIDSVFIIAFIFIYPPTYTNFRDYEHHNKNYIMMNSYLPEMEFTNSDDINEPLLMMPMYAHGGGLNSCGCHFNRKTGECHCHRDYGCGCECQPSRCN